LKIEFGGLMHPYEWKRTMKTMTMRSRFFSPLRGKALVALIASSAVCAMAGFTMMPAHAEANDKGDEHRDEGNHRDQGHGDREHVDGDRRGHEERRFYPQVIYAPPAVYYPSQQSPGVSLFLPLDIHIR
jgi:hypothetical protein